MNPISLCVVNGPSQSVDVHITARRKRGVCHASPMGGSIFLCLCHRRIFFQLWKDPKNKKKSPDQGRDHAAFISVCDHPKSPSIGWTPGVPEKNKRAGNQVSLKKKWAPAL